jgi:hypothetical protein
MVVLGLLAAGVVAVLLGVVGRSVRKRRLRWRMQGCVTEEAARDNAAPLTTAIVSASRKRGRGKTV